MSRRFHILPIYNGPESLLRGLPRFADEHGEYVTVNDNQFYTEVFPVMSKTVRRIAYLLRKMNAYQMQRYAYFRRSSAYTPPASRYDRLLAYKDALNARIEAERSAGL
ncbi:hypothetical protein ACFSL6_23990 [Paenibacillus thailandensis]|uniref:Transposase n=1 Tax=Paenibacillus thailandensis TaxID=393250 RepID=A0ABW5R2G6_9BACL